MISLARRSLGGGGNAAACLFCVLVLAKVLVIGFASPLLFLQDALVALLFACLEFGLRGRKWIWIPYGFAVAWIAINVPVALVLRSWLTWPMLRAASGPLADSIRYYLTPANLAPLALVVAVGVALPILTRRRSFVVGIVAISVVLLIGGATAKAKAASGFDRNAVTVLFSGSGIAIGGVRSGGVEDHSVLRRISRESALAKNGGDGETGARLPSISAAFAAPREA